MQANFFNELPVGITVCDTQGIIISMNDRAALIFKRNGGRDLIGKSLMNCHPADAQTKVAELLETRKSHAYTVEIAGVKWLLYQSPWYEEKQFKGLVEFILPLPSEMAQLPEIRWVKQPPAEQT